MARPRLWASDAERKRAARQSGQVDGHDDSLGVNGQINGLAERPETMEPAGDDLINGQADGAETQPPGFVAFVDCPDVPHDCRADPWIGAGRGTVRAYKGLHYVLVARGTADPERPEHGVVSATDWHARLAQHCAHGLAGWACHAC